MAQETALDVAVRALRFEPVMSEHTAVAFDQLLEAMDTGNFTRVRSLLMSDDFLMLGPASESTPGYFLATVLVNAFAKQYVSSKVVSHSPYAIVANYGYAKAIDNLATTVALPIADVDQAVRRYIAKWAMSLNPRYCVGKSKYVVMFFAQEFMEHPETRIEDILTLASPTSSLVALLNQTVRAW